MILESRVWLIVTRGACELYEKIKVALEWGSVCRLQLASKGNYEEEFD